jgi:hypothetical protein
VLQVAVQAVLDGHEGKCVILDNGCAQKVQLVGSHAQTGIGVEAVEDVDSDHAAKDGVPKELEHLVVPVLLVHPRPAVQTGVPYGFQFTLCHLPRLRQCSLPCRWCGAESLVGCAVHHTSWITCFGWNSRVAQSLLLQ